MEKEILTNEEAARLLRTSSRTLRRWRSDGTGPPFMRVSSTTVLYSRTAILEWLINNSTNKEGETA